MKFGNKKIATLGIFIGLSFAVFGGAVDFAYAVDNSSYVPLAPLPGTTKSNCVPSKEGEKPPKECTDLNTYIPGIFNLAIGIAGVLAVLMIVIGGVEYMTTDAIGGKSEGKERINNALMGLLLVLVSWILLHTINPKLTIFDLDVTSQEFKAHKDIIDKDYIGTGAALKNIEKTESIEHKNPEYTISRNTLVTQYEGGGETTVITDNWSYKENTYMSITKINKDGGFSTETYKNDILESVDGVKPEYDFGTGN